MRQGRLVGILRSVWHVWFSFGVRANTCRSAAISQNEMLSAASVHKSYMMLSINLAAFLVDCRASWLFLSSFAFMCVVQSGWINEEACIIPWPWPLNVTGSLHNHLFYDFNVNVLFRFLTVTSSITVKSLYEQFFNSKGHIVARGLTGMRIILANF